MTRIGEGRNLGHRRGPNLGIPPTQHKLGNRLLPRYLGTHNLSFVAKFKHLPIRLQSMATQLLNTANRGALFRFRSAVDITRIGTELAFAWAEMRGRLVEELRL